VSKKQKKQPRHKRRFHPGTIKRQGDPTQPHSDPAETWDDPAQPHSDPAETWDDPETWDDLAETWDDPDAWDNLEETELVERIRRQDRVPTRKAIKELEKRQRDRATQRLYRRIAQDIRRQRQG